MKRRINWWVVMILAGGLAIRLYQLSPSLLERTVNRQVLDAALVRGLYQRGLADLGMYLYGFPLYHWLVTVGYKILGTTNEVVGRIISVAASVAAAYYLFKLVRLWESKQLAIASLFFFYLASPINIIMSRSFLVDEFTLALNLGAIYYLSLWKKQKREKLFLVGCGLLALMLMSKITFGYVLLPVAYVMGRQWKRWGLLGIIVLVPTLAWYFYGKNINRQLSQGTTGWDIWFWFSPGQLLNPQFYINGFVFISTWVTTPIGFILGMIGLGLKKSFKALTLFYVWLVAGGLFLLFFNRASLTHNYYYFAVLVPTSVLAAQASLRLIKVTSKWRWVLPKTYILFGLAITIGLTLVNPEFLRAYRVYPPYREIPLAANKVESITLPQDVIVVSAHNTAALGYFANRTSFDLWLKSITDQEAIEALKLYRQRGAKYYVVYDEADLVDKPMLKNYLLGLSLVATETWGKIYRWD